MTSNMIYIVALGVGFKCPRKIHLNIFLRFFGKSKTIAIGYSEGFRFLTSFFPFFRTMRMKWTKNPLYA